jgi:hypothetical protein
VAKRYHSPLTPCERLLQSDRIPDVAKAKLREVSAELDPLKLLEEVRAVQAHLAALADGEMPPAMTAEPPNLAAFVASLSSAWRAGEIRPTFSMEAKPRYLRSLQKVSNSLKSSASGSRGDLQSGSTKRSYDTSIAGVRMLAREASSSARRPTGESATNRVAGARISSKTTGRR